jgi:hypothetical protein
MKGGQLVLYLLGRANRQKMMLFDEESGLTCLPGIAVFGPRDFQEFLSTARSTYKNFQQSQSSGPTKYNFLFSDLL